MVSFRAPAVLLGLWEGLDCAQVALSRWFGSASFRFPQLALFLTEAARNGTSSRPRWTCPLKDHTRQLTPKWRPTAELNISIKEEV